MKRLPLKSLLALVVVLVPAVTAWAFYSTGGSGTASGTVGNMTAPAVTVPADSTGSHTVSWTAATLTGNPPEASEITYTVERRLATDTEFAPITAGGCAASFNAATLSCTDSVGTSGDYVYRVLAEFRSWTATSAAAGPVEVTVGGGDTTAPDVQSIVRAGTSPTNAGSVDFTVTFSENVTGVDVSDFDVAATGVAGASVDSVAGSDDEYTVTVNTGTGDGTLGLDLDDDDSIVDGASNKLGGTGVDNGDFTGEAYAIDKTAPAVQSISRVSGTPTNAASVQWTVAFSETVSGVGTADFALAVSGVSGASITGVTGSGSSYTVTASTGTGTGTLGLNLTDDDSIADAATNKLGGTGTGNGNFTGELYTVDRTAPTVVGITRDGANPTNASSVSWTVKISESVTGLTQSDFQLSQISGVSGASITGFSGSGDTYTITANTGSGSGMLSVALMDDDSVVDGAGNPLYGPGTNNFAGQVYTIDKTAPQLESLTMYDDNNDGKVERVDATFDDVLATSGASVTTGWSTSAHRPGGVTLNSVAVTGSTASLNFTGGTAGVNSTTPTQAGGDFTISLSSVTGQIRDALGNKSSISAEKPLDEASPVPFLFEDSDGSSNGLFQSNDTATLTFSENVANSASTTTSVVLTDPPGNNPTDEWSAPGFIEGTTSLGNTGSVNYMNGNNNSATFGSSTLNQPASNKVRVTLGSCTSGDCGSVTTATSATNVAIVPSTTITDLSGNESAQNSAFSSISIRLF